MRDIKSHPITFVEIIQTLTRLRDKAKADIAASETVGDIDDLVLDAALEVVWNYCDLCES